ncbi:MAG: hypothetical protein ACLPY1_22320 [Terracidiphilus sp.]
MTNQPTSVVMFFVCFTACICLTACSTSQISSVPSSPVAPTQPVAPTPPTAAAVSYVDCSAPTNGTGTQASPWNTLASVSSTTFSLGDQLLFKRGMTCSGVLAPLGSGTTASPIVIDAYGTGPQPIIDGGMNLAAVQLNNQQGWEINNLEIVGGNYYGVYIAGTTPNTTYTHFRLTNLNIHGAHFTTVNLDDSSEVFFSPGGYGNAFNDVVLDGVIAHDSHVSNGIQVQGGDAWGSGVLGNSITIQNSTAYNVDGDGILLEAATDGIEQNNVAYNTGQCALRTGCSANSSSGIWELYCHGCIVQNNESYANQTWDGYDGGDYDIDVWNNDNIVQYNYGHDSAGYCVSTFSAGNVVGTNNIIRYNVCSNNSQLVNSNDPCEIDISTWEGGTLNGLQIYNNTFYFNPATPGAAIHTSYATFSGSNPNLIENNIIYSTVPWLINTTSDFTLDNNIYFTTGAAPDWNIDGTDYTDFSSYQSASSQDAHSLFTDPMLNNPAYHDVGRPVSAFTLLPRSPAIGAGADVCAGIIGCSMGTQDFWGNPLPGGSGYNIGAWQ